MSVSFSSFVGDLGEWMRSVGLEFSSGSEELLLLVIDTLAGCSSCGSFNVVRGDLGDGDFACKSEVFDTVGGDFGDEILFGW